MSDRDDSTPAASSVPERLLGNRANPPTPEDIREIQTNLVGFFTVVREWAAREEARPPPGKP